MLTNDTERRDQQVSFINAVTIIQKEKRKTTLGNQTKQNETKDI